MARAEIRKLADKLDNAFQTFAHDNGDGFSSHDWQGAYDYREEGYELAVEASLMPEVMQAAHIETEIEGFDESARYLIRCAVDYRLAEIADHRSSVVVVERRAAA